VAGRGRSGNGGGRGAGGGYQGGYDHDDGPRRAPASGSRGGGRNGGGRSNGGRSGGAKRGRGKPGRGFWGGLAYWTAVFALWAAIAGVGVFIWVASDLPDPEELLAKTDRPSITYVDVEGQVLARRGASDAPPIDLKTLPAYVPAAILAIEDRKFYRHFGFDFEGLARATYTNVRAGRVVQGGSTLTQQLAKNLFLSSEQSLKRKAQELLLSLWLESRFTKEEILSLYMARVYYGAGAYGMVDAAERYFNKSPANLTVSEAAMLAGLLKAPSRLNPVSNAGRAAERATVVLNVMRAEGVITEEQRLAATNAPLRFATTARGSGINYFLDWIEADVGAIVAEPSEDVIVETTLDLRHQRAAEAALTKEFAATGRSGRMGQGALIAIAGDGGVRAMIGGTSYNESEFNRVTEASRQPGSAFKPFVYLAALEAGMTPYTIMVDGPLRVGDWSPQNYNGRYAGSMTLMSALARSVNTIAVQLGERVGREAVVRAARRMGVRARLDPEVTLALGTEVVRPIELATAYVPFANGGYGVSAHGFKRVRTRSGRILWERPAPQPRRVVDDGVLRNMNMMLAQVVSAGTAASARLPDRPVAGKTGTTSDYRDAWFVGYTGGYVTAVWVGNDDFGIKMNRVTGGAAPARIWRDFMVSALAGTPARAFKLPVPGETATGITVDTAATGVPPIGIDPAVPVDGAYPLAPGLTDGGTPADPGMGENPAIPVPPASPDGSPPVFIPPPQSDTSRTQPGAARVRTIDELIQDVQGNRPQPIEPGQQ
jgi:penicillin-binding protein 1A